MSNYNAQHWREKLELTDHPEGGNYRRTYASGLVLPQEVLSKGHNGARHAATSIYFLLEHGECSAFHRIASDELWHFYDGDGLVIYEIKPDGTLVTHQLGRDIDAGQSPQLVIPAGSWFASRVEVQGGYALCGCTVSPGFDFEDFDLGERATLGAEYPQHKELIAAMTLANIRP